ncbi:abortive infection protein, AbiV family [Sediminibacterium ginsengisoli]|uniref:Abortive infection protein, AbiV family n=1 Tax=Sediminibacterium ginsengisoli TaxID=413434 RepID=A0A1T4JPS2_9BACT|nr:abortive infection protein, AbiV family [Sediminibacterium ginsengisoli]
MSRTGDAAAAQNDYGVACSLNILAAEELLKASFLLIKIYHPDGNINEFDNIFHKHKVKHDQIKQHVEFQEQMQKDLKMYLEEYEPIIGALNLMSSTMTKDKQKLVTEINSSITLFKKHSEFGFDIRGMLNWLQNANNDKNRGFYVDKAMNKWLSPQSISKEKFDIERKYTKDFAQYINNIDQLFSLKSKMKNSS